MEPHSSKLDPRSARLHRAIRFLRRFWWAPVMAAMLAAAAQALWLFSQPESHTAVARMWVGGKVRLPESSYFSEEWQNFFGTQTELMQSEKIRRRALEKIRTKHPQADIERISLSVSQPRKTTIFNITAQGSDPALVEAYANAVMEEYLSYKGEVRATSSDDTVASLAAQLEKVERDIESDQEKLATFQRTNNITVLREISVSTGTQLNKLNLQLADLRLEADMLELISPEEHIEKESKSVFERWPDSSLGGSQKDYFSIRQERDLKNLEIKDLSQFMRPEHPTIAKLGEDRKRLDELLAIYVQQARERLEGSRATLRLKMQAVQSAIAALEPRVVAANEHLAQHERNSRSIERLQQMQNRLLNAIHNVDVNKSVDQESVSIMDRAAVFPTSKRLPILSAVAGMVGIVIGLGVVLLIEQFDRRVRTPDDLRMFIPARMIGVIPETGARAKHEKLSHLAPGDQRHVFVESFRHLRGAVRALGRDTGAPHVLMIASASTGEGKSTIAINLALSLAYSNARVLLIDADLRKGRLHEALALPVATGLSNMFSEEFRLEQIVQPTAVPNLWFVGAGPLHPTGAEYLADAMFAKIVSEARTSYDYILIDTPPLLAVADGAAIAPLADTVVFVASNGRSDLRHVLHGVNLLAERNARKIVTVLNRGNPAPGDNSFYEYAASMAVVARAAG